MRSFLSLSAIALFATFVLTACQTATTSPQQANGARQTNAARQTAANSGGHTADDGHGHGQEDNVKRISVEEAKAAVDGGKAVIVDVRAAEAYKMRHIKGSISMPNVATDYQSLPKDKQLITYCS